MAVTLCHASIDENGKISGGAAGDQTGKEVCTRAWYNKPWNIMLRFKDKTIAKKAAAIAKKLADSNLVGYDQGGRNTLYQALKAANFDADKYIASGKKTEADCSSFIFAAFCCVIAALRADGNAPTTSTMRAKFKAAGFTVYTDSKYLTSDKYLITGDVLVKEGSHTAMAITDGASTSTTTATSTTKKTATESAQKKDSSIAGTYKTTANLNLRTGAGTSKTVLVVIPSGTEVKNYGYYTEVSGTQWLYIQLTLKGVTYTGFASEKYLKKC